MKPNIIFIAGDLIKHKYFILSLLKDFESSKVIFEKYNPKIFSNYTPHFDSVIEDHFRKVILYDKNFFEKEVLNEQEFIDKKTLRNIERGEVNDVKFINYIKKIKPDIIIINATSILSKNFIDNFKNKIINVHAGLCPYYWGSGCNVWPFFYDELEFIGMTVHYVNEFVDKGNIILQSRPHLELTDNTHSVGCKNNIAGIELTKKVLNSFIKQKYLPKGWKQDKLKNIRVCKKKNFTKEVIIKINQNFKEGIVEKYIKNQKAIKIKVEL